MAPAAAMPLPDLWDDVHAAGLDEPGLLLYRSNLLGSDHRITNFGGGNTSALVETADPLTGEMVKVLWVKGSGGDLGSIERDGFATLYLDRLRTLKSHYGGLAHEDEMVHKLPYCTFDLNPRAASIDTPLRAFVPYEHVDHMHPDAVIAIAAAANSQALTRRIFGDEIGWLPWRRPGFELGLELERLARDNPHLNGVVLGGHGLFTWGHTERDCYRATLRIINRAAEWLAASQKTPVFGGERRPSLSPEERVARPARPVEQGHGRRTGGGLPAALVAEAVSLSRGHRRGVVFSRLRRGREVDRQHHQCRRLQRRFIHPLGLATL